jgi:hypothetical protein
MNSDAASSSFFDSSTGDEVYNLEEVKLKQLVLYSIGIIAFSVFVLTSSMSKLIVKSYSKDYQVF